MRLLLAVVLLALLAIQPAEATCHYCYNGGVGTCPSGSTCTTSSTTDHEETHTLGHDGRGCQEAAADNSRAACA